MRVIVVGAAMAGVSAATDCEEAILSDQALCKNAPPGRAGAGDDTAWRAALSARVRACEP